MDRIQNIGKEILDAIKAGNINIEFAFQIIKELKEIKESSKGNSKQTDIAVIGIACKFPGAKNKQEYWYNLKNGICSIGPFPSERETDIRNLFLQSKIKAKKQFAIAGYLDEIDKFDPSFFKIAPKEAQFIHPIQRNFLETAYEAFEDAGYGRDLIYGTKTGVYVGLDHTTEFNYSRYFEKDDILLTIGSYSGILASRISYIFNLRGPALVVDTACSSGLVAVHTACQGLINNECEMAIAGGINLFLYRYQGTLSGVDSVDNIVKAFDKNGTGTVWGEGVGAVLLKPFNKALEDGDHIYGVIKGSAINNDGASNGITAPSAEAQTELLLHAWSNADIDPSTITYMETHGTGTVLGDPIEIKGLTDAFNQYTEKRQFCAIGSVKNNIGHPIGASGLASLIKVLLSMKNKEIPANINFDVPNPFINFPNSPIYVNDKSRPWISQDFSRRAGINAFGFSGTNCHVILEEAPERTRIIDEEQEGIYLLALSAQYREGIFELVKSYREFLYEADINLNDLCMTANIGRGHYSYRLMVLFIDIKDLKHKLESIIAVETLESASIQDVYFDKHKVVVGKREHLDEGEYSEDEIRILTLSINSKLKDLDRKDEPKYRGLLEEICSSYIKGAEIDWSEFYRGKKYQKMSLPTYPFQMKRCWVEFAERPREETSIANLYYESVWRIQKGSETGEIPSGNTLLFKDAKGFGEKFADAMRKSGAEIIEVEIGPSYIKRNNNSYLIGASEAEYEKLLKELQGRGIHRILHLLTLPGEPVTGVQDLEVNLKRGAYSLLNLLKAFVKLRRLEIGEELELILITENTNEITGDEARINPENAIFIGLGKVINQEFPGIHCRSIDIDQKTTIDDLVQEIETGSNNYQVALRDGTRYIEEFRETTLEEKPIREVTIREEGVYLITGGVGGIGLVISKYLAMKNHVNLALISRAGLPIREQWEKIITENKDTNTCQKIKAIQEIESLGGKVELYCADISKIDEVQAVCNELRVKHGKINGIVHCAGINWSGSMVNGDEVEFQKVLLSKVHGTWILDRVTKDDDLDFLVMFSSVASLFGFHGQGYYAAANSYLDNYTLYRNRQGKRTITINWPAWKETGMAVNSGNTRDGAFKAILNHEALAAFDKVLNRDIKKILIGEMNYKNAVFYGTFHFPFRLSDSIISSIEKQRGIIDSQVSYNQKINETNSSNQRINPTQVIIKGKGQTECSHIEKKLAQIWSNVLGLEEIDLNESFYAMGGNSLLVVSLINSIEREYPGTINVSHIYAYPSVIEMAKFINSKIGGVKEGLTIKKEDTTESSDQEIKNLIHQLKTGESKAENILEIINKWGVKKDE